MEGPLLIVPKGWTPTRIRRQGRDSKGRRVQRTFKRHEGTGRVNGFEHETADGRQHAALETEPITAEFHPSDFGLTKQQFIELLKFNVRAFPTPPRRHGRLIVPGQEMTWQ